MYPVLFEWGAIRLHSYGLMIAVGFLMGVWLMQRDASKRHVDPAVVSELAIMSLLIGVVASRLLHIIMFSQDYALTDPVGLIAVWRGGLVFQGAIPAVILYLYWALRRRGVDFWKMADIVMPYVPLAQAFGRMGCFFNGCCYGRPSNDLPWGLQFPESSPPFQMHAHQYPDFVAAHNHSLPIHPTQLYSIVALGIMTGLLLVLRRWWHPFLGFTLPLYFIFYGIKRVNVEHFRGDGNPTDLGFGLLTDQQVYSLLMLLFGVLWFAWLWRRGNMSTPVLESVRHEEIHKDEKGSKHTKGRKRTKRNKRK